VIADMLADPARGQRLVTRTANSFMNKPDKERGSILSTAVRHTAWLDDPRLEAAVSRSDFDIRDLKRQKMTIYVAIPPDRMRGSLGFMRGFIGLGLNAMTSVPGNPASKVAFFLDEFGQLGRMDSIADNITLLRGYGVQFWLFVQDLSQLKGVYPRWQTFLANTTQQYFGTADLDTAKYISEMLGQHTIQFQTSSSSTQTGLKNALGGGSAGVSEHYQGRSLATPDEILSLSRDKAIVMTAGERPYLLNRLNYLTDTPYDQSYDANPMYAPGGS
jgi:type IV secretory pathway TraG/TraD family ATPase VirD4